MTEVEKAKELVDKMYTCCKGHIDKYTAKQCALIAVDEIVNCDRYFNSLADAKEFINYWYEVQKEIENL